MWRFLVQHGHAGIVETFWNDDTVRQLCVPFDEGAQHQAMGDHDQRAANQQGGENDRCDAGDTG